MKKAFALKLVSLAAAAGISMSFATSAKAGTTYLSGYLPYPSPYALVDVSEGSNHYNGAIAGQINWTPVTDTKLLNPILAGGTTGNFSTFCTQINNDVYIGTNSTFEYTALSSTADLTLNAGGNTSGGSYTWSGGGTLASARAIAIDNLLFSDFNSINGSGNFAAAIQLAIWTIVYDAPTAGVWTLPSGTSGTGFYYNASDGTTSAVATIANNLLSQKVNGSYIASGNGLDPGATSLSGLMADNIFDGESGSGGQNQAILASGGPNVSTSTPLPASFGGVAVLLALGGLLGRRFKLA